MNCRLQVWVIFPYSYILVKSPFKWFGAILQNMAIIKEEQAYQIVNGYCFSVEIIAEFVVNI